MDKEMKKGSHESKKGVGVVIGTALFIIVALMCLSAIWMIGNSETRYREVRDKMARWDTERISEDLKIKDLVNVGPGGYDITLTVDNIGGVLVDTARIYVYDQTNKSRLYIYDRQNGSNIGFKNGTINTGEKDHRIFINGTNLEGGHDYRIILATDRGRLFGYTYPPPPPAGGGGGYALILADDDDNFQYQNNVDSNWKSAFVKSVKCTRNLYRALLNNTTNRRILFHQNSTMLQMAGKTGQVIPRYIVAAAPESSATPDHLVAFSGQAIDPGQSQYIYFAAETIGGNTWLAEASQSNWLVSFLLYWQYEGETEIRNISTPAIAQELTSAACQ